MPNEVTMKKSMPLMHIASMVYNTPLMISSAKLETVMSVLGPRFAGGELMSAAEMRMDTDETKDMRLPAELDEAGSVRVISIDGILMHKARGMDALSGMVSYEQITQSIKDAHADDSIDAIVLDLCTPGGMVQGAFDTADTIKNLSMTKPIYAIVNEEANSAGYLLASAATKIYVTRTSTVGSIGVIMQHVDISELNAKMGIKHTDIFAGRKKTDFSPNSPLSDSARADAQREVDDLRMLFAATVAENRELPVAEVLATEAAVFVGQATVEVGLADVVMSVDDAFNNIFELITNRSERTMPRSQPDVTTATQAAATTQTVDTTTSAPAINMISAEDAAKMASTAAIEAVTTERTRISAIHALPEAEGKTALCEQLVSMGTSVEDAQKLLGAAPSAAAATTTTKVSDPLAVAMQNVTDPDVGPNDDAVDADVDDDHALIAEMLGHAGLSIVK